VHRDSEVCSLYRGCEDARLRHEHEMEEAAIRAWAALPPQHLIAASTSIDNLRATQFVSAVVRSSMFISLRSG
jgi:hypothetical protein